VPPARPACYLPFQYAISEDFSQCWGNFSWILQIQFMWPASNKNYAALLKLFLKVNFSKFTSSKCLSLPPTPARGPIWSPALLKYQQWFTHEIEFSLLILGTLFPRSPVISNKGLSLPPCLKSILFQRREPWKGKWRA